MCQAEPWGTDSRHKHASLEQFGAQAQGTLIITDEQREDRRTAPAERKSAVSKPGTYRCRTVPQTLPTLRFAPYHVHGHACRRNG